MLFIVKWNIRPENRNAAIERFLKTGGKAPDGVKMLGRWHAVAQLSGVAVIEASDAELIQQWVMEWNDLLCMEAFPALTDEQIGPLMAVAIEKLESTLSGAI
ncbi:DUF3303 domain-containing protein [Acinetobacter sp. MB5]|uniref:DUF3303 domain-containing protein n=1 Tax=Acinetobacter sp. MB5 TaxID=2069438 RepID=UPI000DD0D283|nr:DUF3303 family protein [Acinetobacter sp. MB5]